MLEQAANNRADGFEPNAAGPRWLLAIDTSTELAGIAITNGERVAEFAWIAGRAQTVTVLPEIEHLLRRLALEPSALGAVAVATGPGTFTGLRVGLSLAKGFSLARDLAIIGVPTLDVAAEPYAAARIAVTVVLAAGRGRLVWAAYEEAGDEYRTIHGPVNTRLDELVAWLRERPAMLVAGELDPAQRAALHTAGHSRIEDSILSQRRPAALAALGWRRWQVGQLDDPTTLEPVYLHAPSPRPQS